MRDLKYKTGDKVIVTNCKTRDESVMVINSATKSSVVIGSMKFDSQSGSRIDEGHEMEHRISPYSYANKTIFIQKELIKRLSCYDWKTLSFTRLKKVYKIIENSTIVEQQNKDK